MAGRYRLVFQGELLDGQHASVVKKRLGQALKLDAQRVERLFDGGAVVIKQEVDRTTAARYQKAFKASGARLRVVETSAQATQAGQATQAPAAASRPTFAEQAPARPATPASPAPSSPERETEFSIAEPGALLGPQSGATPPEAPDTSHLSIAALGSNLLERIAELPVVEVEIDPQWELAKLGADLGQIVSDQEPDVVVDAEFTLAPPGAQIDERKPSPAPSPPDTSHLTLEKA